MQLPALPSRMPKPSLIDFHELRGFFVDAGVRTSTSLPRQHALLHSIPLFGSPNGLCSSITESKHIKAVKEPWRRSSRFRALVQMLQIIIRLEKLAALRRLFLHQSMLIGSSAGYIAKSYYKYDNLDDDDDPNDEQGKERLHDTGPVDGPQALSSIVLASTPGKLLMLSLSTSAGTDCYL
jgi:hypothetical protein